MTIPVVAPFNLAFTVWVLRRRKANIIDLWEQDKYSRVMVFDRQVVKIVVVQKGTIDTPYLELTLLGLKKKILMFKKRFSGLFKECLA